MNCTSLFCIFAKGLQQVQQTMGQASSTVGDHDDAATSDAAIGAREPATRFVVQPVTPILKVKSATLVLEVDALGFRLLKPKTFDALRAFGWGEIHSWLHSPGRFSFRFYEEKSQTIVEYSFKLQQVEELLASMEIFIEAVMSQRREKAISEAEFEQLIVQLERTTSADRALRIATAAQFCFFTSLQGSTLMGTVDNTFDKMDVAIALHHRLIDQTEFATLLCCLECEEDRDNVWHRILTNKAHKQPVPT